jgi:hypothetical protein
MPLPRTTLDHNRLNEFAQSDRRWRAGLLTLHSRALTDQVRAWQHVDPATPHLDFEAMLRERGWSTTECLLLQLGASLWGSGASVDLGRLIELADPDTEATVLSAVQALVCA